MVRRTATGAVDVHRVEVGAAACDRDEGESEPSGEKTASLEFLSRAAIDRRSRGRRGDFRRGLPALDRGPRRASGRRGRRRSVRSRRRSSTASAAASGRRRGRRSRSSAGVGHHFPLLAVAVRMKATEAPSGLITGPEGLRAARRSLQARSVAAADVDRDPGLPLWACGRSREGERRAVSRTSSAATMAERFRLAYRRSATAGPPGRPEGL